MDLAIRINLDNEAFEEQPEVEIRRILLDAAQKIEVGLTFGALFDTSGNQVGKFEFIVD